MFCNCYSKNADQHTVRCAIWIDVVIDVIHVNTRPLEADVENMRGLLKFIYGYHKPAFSHIQTSINKQTSFIT